MARVATLCRQALTHAITRTRREQHDIKAWWWLNTATAAAIHEAQQPLPDLLLVDSAIKSVLAVTKIGHVGGIGTRGTPTCQALAS